MRLIASVISLQQFGVLLSNMSAKPQKKNAKTLGGTLSGWHSLLIHSLVIWCQSRRLLRQRRTI